MELLWYLTVIFYLQVRGYKSICLLGLTELAQAILLHSLFLVCERYFSDPDIWGILGGLPSEPPPQVCPHHVISEEDHLREMGMIY